MSELHAQPKYKVVKDHIRTYDDPISVHVGEKIRVGQRDTEWRAWFWCTNSQQESGWVPEQVLDIHGDGTATVKKDYHSIELN
ncbi:SH3 domain-containing protein [Alicyclobacillus kakegawensis]|uniref:SH3 domain-containing protein n=1 Tax=Alicyclobacillus kakegawensis TaxID=392012 RepID=UPI0009F8F333|nr:SH3 domain-containing protein [Alicyclobacillus kakegawensis]